MTRINVLPPDLLLDQWVSAHLRESLRPINKFLDNKYRKLPIVGQFRLNTGHELWGAGQSLFVSNQWKLYKVEYLSRGFKGFDFDPDCYKLMPLEYQNDYQPTEQDFIVNIQRLIERWNKRSNKTNYTFKGKLIKNDQDFKNWLDLLTASLNLKEVRNLDNANT